MIDGDVKSKKVEFEFEMNDMGLFFGSISKQPLGLPMQNSDLTSKWDVMGTMEPVDA